MMHRKSYFPPALKYKELPKYQQKELIDLYIASSEELGHECVVRKKKLLSIFKVYYPFYTPLDLESAYTLISKREMMREQSKMITYLHGEYGHRVVKLFGTWDDDGNGVISLDEFKCAFTRIGLSDHTINAHFRDADLNGDGELDVDELFKFISKHPIIFKQLEKVMDHAEGYQKQKELDNKKLLFKKVPLNEDGTKRRPSLSDLRSLSEQVEVLRSSHMLI